MKTNRDKAYTENEIGNYLFGKTRDFGEALLKGLTTGLVVKPSLDVIDGKVEGVRLVEGAWLGFQTYN